MTAPVDRPQHAHRHPMPASRPHGPDAPRVVHSHHDHHDHHADHDHDHHHAGHASSNTRLLLWALVLTVAFMVVESISGWIANSLALLADAGHMFTDSAALALALAAAYFAKRAPDSKRSFGYHRLQVLATFINGVALLLIVGFIAIEAFQKFFSPAPVNTTLMLGVAAGGAAINVIVFLMLRKGDHGDMNIAAATLHVLGDLLGSVGAIAAALIIMWTNWTPIDPILSVLLCVLIVRSAWALVRRSAHILLEGTPDWLDIPSLRATLIAEVPSITDVHHVHCWSLSPRETLITLHATVNASADHTAVLHAAHHALAEHFGITHATIQLEYGACADEDCE